jgi:hypothetical protein
MGRHQAEQIALGLIGQQVKVGREDLLEEFGAVAAVIKTTVKRRLPTSARTCARMSGSILTKPALASAVIMNSGSPVLRSKVRSGL